MKICNIPHEEVVYEGKKCPMCLIIKHYQNRLIDLMIEIKNLNKREISVGEFK